jgi:predicted PurR-regulated permease PerM
MGSIGAEELRTGFKFPALVGIVVVIAGLYFGRQVLIPLALAIVLAVLFGPIVVGLEKCHFGRVPSVLGALVLFASLFAAVGWGVSSQLLDVISDLPAYKNNIHNRIEAIHSPSNGGLGKAAATVNDISKELSSASEPGAAKRLGGNKSKDPVAVQVATSPRTAKEYLRDILGPLAGILETTVIVIVFTLFILIKREDLRNRMLRLAGSGQLNVMTQAMNDASTRLSRYLLLQFTVNVGYGLLFGLGLYAIGLPHPLLWGVLSSFLRFIPYIGTPVATAFPMAMALAVFPGWNQVGLVFGLFLFLEITIANVVEPLLYGAHTGISSLAILVAAIFWGMLWGPVGLILSTPLTVCLILIGRYVPDLNFLEIILGDEPVLSPQAHFYQRLLALDDDEAREIAERYLKEHSLEDLYDSVLIPALSLAERDRHTNALDETRRAFIYRGTRELVEELYEISQEQADSVRCEVSKTPVSPFSSKSKIVCLPARDEADEIVGTMISHLFRSAGYKVRQIDAGSIPAMLSQLEMLNPQVVCVSALPPFAAVQAKSLCKQVRQRFPRAKIVLGLWRFPGGVEKAQERVGFNCADMICTSAAQLISILTKNNFFSSSDSGVIHTQFKE